MRPTHYLLYYWQNQNEDVEAYVPQINLGESVKNQKNWDTISLSSLHPNPTLFFMTLISLIVPNIWIGEYYYTLLVTILVIHNRKHIFHLQQILKRDEEWRLSKKWNSWWGKVG